MAEKQTIDAMWDDSPIDVSTEVNFIWSIANKLRGTYQSDKYKDVIIPMVIIRRFECALAPTKQKVVETYKANPNYPAKAMYRISGFQFYNTSEFDLAELVNDADHLAANFKAYLQSFSPNVQEIIVSAEKGLDFYKQIDKMDKNNRLLSVVKAFSELDLDPRTIDNVKMGYIFEDLIRRFSENAEAGDHYTGRDIIKLMVNILLAEGCDDIFDDGKVITVLDQACGTGGMLSTSYNFIKRYNPTADVRLFGQEINPESYAICLAEMLIKGQNAENICYQDTMKKDRFPETKMRFVIENPPFGTPWGGKDAAEGVEDAVNEEYKKGFDGRWGAGLPGSGDMQMLFLQSAIDKMDDNLGRAAIIEHTGTIVDATFVDAPRQRNTREENNQIKNGEIPKEWEKNTHKLAQKDTDARWTKKNDETHYGYKNHVKVDADSKIITDYATTSANIHDSNEFSEFLGEADKVIYADSAYVGKEIPKHVENRICEKGYRGKPLTDEQKESNRRKSKIRCRIEHVFGFITVSMHGLTVRSIGIKRAEFNIGLTNLVYNFCRYTILKRKEVYMG